MAKLDPATDFYTYVNHTWQHQAHVSSFRGSFGVSEEIEDAVQATLLDSIHALQNKHTKSGLALLAKSFQHPRASSVDELRAFVHSLDSLRVEDVGAAIGHLNRIQAKAPISLVVASDSYASSKCCVYLYEPQLGISETSAYSSRHLLKAYRHMLTQLGELLQVEALDSVVRIEHAVLPTLTTYDEQSDIRYFYNPYTLEELSVRYHSVPWESMLVAWGIHAKDIPHIQDKKLKFIDTNPRYTRMFDRMFRTFDIVAWRTWLQASAILSFFTYLPAPYNDLDFEFYDKLMKGATHKQPASRAMLDVLQTYAPQALGRLYVSQVPKGTKAYAIKMVHDLKTAAIARLQNLAWMDPRTRANAVHKVSAMKLQIAYPEHWEPETDTVPMSGTQPLQNIWNLNAQDTDKMIHDITRGCRKTEEHWEDGIFEVNAYYYPEGNMIVIPAAILQSPFFDLRRSRAWNLGGIGAAIGHEITHGFDDVGRMYDAAGNYKNWWADADSKAYTRLTKALVRLFDGVAYMGGKVDGELTLSENIADLGGLAIALHALQEGKHEVSEEEYRDFFTSYAVSWRNKDRAVKAARSLTSDGHAPASLRVNLIVRQFEEFYAAFHIGEDSPGYIAKKDRIVLW